MVMKGLQFKPSKPDTRAMENERHQRETEYTEKSLELRANNRKLKASIRALKQLQEHLEN